MEVIQSAITIVVFFLILGGLVLVHELGHFVTARLAKVRVLEFGIGFPPRAKVLGEGGVSAEDEARVVARREQRLREARATDPQLAEEILDEEPERAHGTLYTLNWLPIGGFVKLEGEDGDATDDPRSFSRAKLPVKLAILVAGVVMNLLVAFLIFFLIAWLLTPIMGVKIGQVDPNSPAQAAGLQAGDEILAVDGRGYELFGPNILAGIRSHMGQAVTLTVRHPDGRVDDLRVQLRSQDQVNGQQGPLGIRDNRQIHTGAYSGRPLGDALTLAFDQTTHALGLILSGLAQLGTQIVTNPTVPPDASGPIGIGIALGDVLWGLGPVFTLLFAGILSANLALVNILPFPPLDGGRILVVVLKSIAGARISMRAERLTYLVGFVLLFAFLIYITAFDIARLGGAIQ
jgi:regulator of sigma E protease